MIEQLIAYFHSSRLQYLALDHAGWSIRLSREQPSTGSGQAESKGVSLAAPAVTQVLAPAVGFIALAQGRNRFPEAGEPVAAGEPLFAVRRFKNTIEVRAAAAGALTSVRVTEGAFVEFAQPLATIN